MEGDSRLGLKAGRLRFTGGTSEEGWSWARMVAARAEKKPAPGGGISSVISLLRVGEVGPDTG